MNDTIFKLIAFINITADRSRFQLEVCYILFPISYIEFSFILYSHFKPFILVFSFGINQYTSTKIAIKSHPEMNFGQTFNSLSSQ